MLGIGTWGGGTIYKTINLLTFHINRMFLRTHYPIYYWRNPSKPRSLILAL